MYIKDYPAGFFSNFIYF